MIRMGIIGCGAMGSNHARYLNELTSDGMIISAAVDIDRSKAEKTVKYLKNAKASTDLRSVLNEMDAVLISLPHNLHHSVGMECLKAGKHVLMEKPLAMTEKECLELIETAKEYNLILMTAYCVRYHPLVVRLKELLDAQAYGKLFNISVWTEQYTNWTLHFPPESRRGSAAVLGGGQLFSHGCHYIDILLWYLGAPEKGFHLGTNYGTPWMEKEGTSHVAIKFENGTMGYHFGTWGAKGSKLCYSIHAHCTEGMLEADITNGKLRLITVGKGGWRRQKKTLLMEYPRAEFKKYHMLEIKHFLDCVKTGRKPLTDARSSLQSLRVIWRLYEAEQLGVVADLRGLGLN
ncbi:MAG: Gfo/Idh/MocA family oxidoreductase [Candidatus Omnitrophica bacterium]|nr:Gfo/Idh/MocA family oxidoreductase [Candidatus Omnitrophota bacterium]